MKKLFFILSIILIFSIHIKTINIYSQPSDNKEIIGDNELLLNDNDIILSDTLLNIGRVFGITGFLLFGLVIFVSGTSGLFDPIFGLNNIIRFHKKFTLFSFFILFFHPVFIILSNISIGLTVSDFFISYLSYPPFVLGGLSFVLFIIIVLTYLLYYKCLNYKLWSSLYIFTIIAFLFAAYHLFYFGVFSGFYSIVPLVNIYIYSGIIFASLGVMIRIVFLFIKKKVSTEIIDILKETNDVSSIYLNKPEGFNYKAGQFCFISFNKKGLSKPHPFFISSSPSEGHLVFTIKNKDKFTSRVLSLNKGTRVKIDGPYGIFKYRKKDSIFITEGVGVIPFKSIIGEKAYFIRGQKIRLIYLNETKNSIIFHSWFDMLMEDNKYLNFNAAYILRNENLPGYEHGSISKHIIIKKSDFKEDFYICGQKKMIKEIISILRKNKVPKKRIYTENVALL